MLKKFIVTFAFAIILIGCATSSLGRKQLLLMPAEQLDTMGAEAFNNIKKETPVETEESVKNYVTCVANAITQVSNSTIEQWEVVVFQDDSANAFALPGGKVGVHTGLLKVAENQHQLAAVVGHEVAHVLENHSNERVSQELAVEQSMAAVQSLSSPGSALGQTVMGLLGAGAQYGVILPYSRKHESEADEVGLYFMARAGFDPKESVNLWRNMSQGNGEQPPEFMSTHPSHETRMARLNQAMKRAMSLYKEAQANGKNPRCG
ncbi:M48 family metallopeptidase [Candidatus Parabeggiatoa sp. HSG14]|uniref:M48 family metallopeptidase n=1 Tax=Candidatus Parabeggiatoa sp. HSG14 TaxID=3055593 RepID=UPI0025A78F83|nr:M48 family metallopeptidase [Thiotrichales bacterium HSG14]